MATIHKQKLEITDEQKILLPEDAEILCVQEQFGSPCIWYKFSSAKSVHRTILTRGTGHQLTGGEDKYIGTYQLQAGELIFHVFTAKHTKQD